MTLRSRVLLSQTFVALGLLGLSACSKSEGEPEPVVSVQAEPVKQGAISQVITTDAVLFPINQATIVPKISAPVKKAYVARGARVHQGQLLITLENQDLAAAAEEARGNLEQAQATRDIATANALPEELQKAEWDAKTAQDNLDAQQKIVESRKVLLEQGAIPRKDYDAANLAFIQARAQYEQAKKHLDGLKAVGHQQELKSANAQLVAAQGKYNNAKSQLDYSNIVSPMNGVVADGPWYPGMMPPAGAPLITIMDISRMIAKAHIPQTQAALVKKGDDASIKVAGSDDDLPGKVVLVSPALDPGSTTVEVWVEADNRKGLLRAGSSVIVSMVARTVPNALTVPAPALITDEEGKKSVMVIGSDGKAHKRDIETGIQTATAVQVVNGLKAGEQVVSVGVYGLPDNTKVKIEAATPPGKGGEEDKGEKGGEP